MSDSHPGVTYVIPVLNEEEHLESTVATVLAQKYPGPSEVILALGPSTDRTTEIADRIAREHAIVRTVANPAGDVSSGLNLAIGQARYPLIARVDAHTQLPPGYTARAVQTLLSTGSTAVGAVMVARGECGVQAAIAKAYNSRFGLGGGAHHRSVTRPGPTESAYLGVIRADAVLGVGGFDPSLRRGQDWELNHRLREHGHLIWIDPELHVDYRPRASLGALRRQMHATGIWRAEIVRRLGAANSVRYFAPPALVLATALAVVLWAAWSLSVVPAYALVSAMVPATYLLAIGLAAAAGRPSLPERILSMAVLTTMHFAWGAGFIRGLVWGARGAVDTSRQSVSAKSFSNERQVTDRRPVRERLWRSADPEVAVADGFSDLYDMVWDLEPALE